MLLPKVKRDQGFLFCPYMVKQEICYPNHELPFSVIAIAKALKVSATELRLKPDYGVFDYPDYDVYLNGNRVGMIYWFLPF